MSLYMVKLLIKVNLIPRIDPDKFTHFMYAKVMKRSGANLIGKDFAGVFSILGLQGTSGKSTSSTDMNMNISIITVLFYYGIVAEMCFKNVRVT